MYIKAARIENYRLFECLDIKTGEINAPDGINEGSGLTVFVGENGTGKTTILDALASTLISYKAANVELNDFLDIDKKIVVIVVSTENFEVNKTMPRASFQVKGFLFYANVRARDTAAYLVGSLTHDIKYIPDPAENIDSNSVELRASVENPYLGSRFKDNDYLFIDKNRNKQLESGMFSSTRFDRILDNFNFQYLKAHRTSLKEPNPKARNEIDAASIENEYLNTAFEEFKNLTNYHVGLSLIDDKQPYLAAKLTYEVEGNQIPISKMGNGYQMLLAVLCQYHLSCQSGKKLIVFIDEAEFHLHHKMQKDLANLLLKISKDAQIILTTHSSELLKNLQPNSNHKINVLKKSSDGSITINPISEYVLPTPSINETAYVALGVDGAEYFNELYGYLQDLKGQTNIANFDAHISNGQTMIQWENSRTGSTQSLSIHSCIRHKLHHPDNTLNDSKFDFDAELPKSITFLRQQIQIHFP